MLLLKRCSQNDQSGPNNGTQNTPLYVGTFADNTELCSSVRILYQMSLYISAITNQSEGENNRVCGI